jgi:hypothetical protein
MKSVRRSTVAAAVEGGTGRAGALLLYELADRTGLTPALSAASGDAFTQVRAHDPGALIGDLAVTLADGGNYLSDRARAVACAAVGVAGTPSSRFTLDVDSTIVGAHSEKEQAMPTYKRAFGLHPLRCSLDQANELLAAKLRLGIVRGRCDPWPDARRGVPRSPWAPPPASMSTFRRLPVQRLGRMLAAKVDGA